eukprot:5823814-Pyramimonas_sp.AAC.1
MAQLDRPLGSLIRGTPIWFLIRKSFGRGRLYLFVKGNRVVVKSNCVDVKGSCVEVKGNLPRSRSCRAS